MKKLKVRISMGEIKTNMNYLYGRKNMNEIKGRTF